MVRGIAVPPQKISFGRSAQRQLAHLVHVDAAGLLRATPYCTGRNHLPVTDTVQPWVRWPPCGSAMPITVSPGCRNAR